MISLCSFNCFVDVARTFFLLGPRGRFITWTFLFLVFFSIVSGTFFLFWFVVSGIVAARNEDAAAIGTVIITNR